MISRISEALSKSYEENSINIKFSKWVAIFGHPFYWFIWTYVLPQQYENALLRFSCVFICIPLFFIKRLPKEYKKFVPIYWYFCLMFNLPLTFTYLTLMNNFSGMWLICESMAISSMIILIPNFLTLFIVFGIGVIIASIMFVSGGNHIDFSTEHLEYVLPLPMVIMSGILFSYTTKLGKIKVGVIEDRAKNMKSLAGSIAHELRNPLNSISLVGAQIKELDSQDPKNLKKEVHELSESLSEVVKSANDIINLILADLSEKPFDVSEMVYLNASQTLPQIIKKYGYRSESEKKKVVLNITSDFIFKASSQRFDFIIYNLLKNALYYVNEYPSSIITVGSEVKDFDGKEFNVVYVSDTGPGIANNMIEKLFGSFYSFGKAGGTGLGLAFCKRNMLLFGGDIICESQLATEDESGVKSGGWTKFSLLFPKISDEELKEVQSYFVEKKAENIAENSQKKDSENQNDDTKFKEIVAQTDSLESTTGNSLQNNSTISSSVAFTSSAIFSAIPKHKILIVDDQRANLLITKSKLEKYLPFVSCDIALGGEEAINFFKAHDYSLILMDIQMPELGGISAAHEIRKIEAAKNKLFSGESHLVPIIAITSLDYETVVDDASKSQIAFDDYINKNSTNHYLLRTIHKWLMVKDHFFYLEDLADIQKIVANQQIILVDDQEMNLKLTKRTLEKNGLKVMCASNGQELVESYKSSISTEFAQKKSNLKLILTDINMPVMSGDEATRAIRKLEAESGIDHQHHIPIILLSGNGEKKDIHNFLKMQIDDYFVKGDDTQNLIKILAVHLEQSNFNNLERELSEGDKNKTLQNSSEEFSAEKSTKKTDEELLVINKTNSELNSGAKLQSQEFQVHPSTLMPAQEYYKMRPELKIFNPEKISFLPTEGQKEIIDLYIKESSGIIQQLKTFYQQSNIKELSFFIHSLKGISGNIGAEKLTHYIKNIEPILKSNQLPSNQSWFDDLVLMYEELLKDLKNSFS